VIRLVEISASDMNDPNRLTPSGHVHQAFGETIRPLIDKLATTIRAELA
jgi:hypothetical protein